MKNDTMSNLIRIFFLLSLLGILCVSSIGSPSECDYGSAQAWFRLSDGPWENATAHPVLKRGEPFEIKLIITVKTELQQFFVKLHEFGTPVYEVINGPMRMEQLLEYKQVTAGRCFTYTWRMKVRSQTTWVNGFAPLEVFVQFNKNDTDEMRISFDVITAFILDQQWEQDQYYNGTESMLSSEVKQNSPPYILFGVFTVILVIIGISFIIKKLTK